MGGDIFEQYIKDMGLISKALQRIHTAKYKKQLD